MDEAIKVALDELRQRTADLAKCIGVSAPKNEAWLLERWLGPSEGKYSPICSFCEKASDAVAKLIAGPRGVFVCNECVDLCREICEGQGAAIEAASGGGADGPAAATVAPEPSV